MGFATFFLGQDFWQQSIVGTFTAKYGLVAFIWLAGFGKYLLI